MRMTHMSWHIIAIKTIRLSEGDKAKKELFERYKGRKKEIESRLESGNVDAKYGILGAITDPDVKKRIIIVGAAQNLGTHKEGGFLGIGAEKNMMGMKLRTLVNVGSVWMLLHGSWHL